MKRRIRINNLPNEVKVTKEEMKKVLGALNPQPEPPGRLLLRTTNFYGGPDTISVTDVDEHQWRR